MPNLTLLTNGERNIPMEDKAIYLTICFRDEKTNRKTKDIEIIYNF